MLGVLKSLICPLCGKGENSKGASFSSPRSLSLHVSWFAIYRNDVHQDWVSKLLGNPDFTGATINQTAAQIDYYLMDLVKEAEELSPEGKAQAEELKQEIEIWTKSLGIPNLVNKEWQRTQEERDHYLRSYAIIWEIETKMHRFFELILSEEHGENWWFAFPLELQHQCLDRAHQDYNQVSPAGYINLLDLSEVIKKKENKTSFQSAFDHLHSSYGDPQSEFHKKLKDVNKIRNKVMHPLKRQTPTGEEIATLDNFLEFVKKLTTEE